MSINKFGKEKEGSPKWSAFVDHPSPSLSSLQSNPLTLALRAEECLDGEVVVYGDAGCEAMDA